MRRIPIDEITVGTKFTKPVYVDGENLLVPENVVVREKDIERLKKWGVFSVLTDGVVVTEIAADAAGDQTFEEPRGKGGGPDPVSTYKKAIRKLDELFEEIKYNRHVEQADLNATLESLIAGTDANPDGMLTQVLLGERADPTPGRSAVDCCILSICVGLSMSLDESQLRTLAFGAALHDLGMLRVPDSIVGKKSDLTIEEIKQVRTHTLHSYKVVAKELGYAEEIGLIGLQHHERWDGKGYPRKLSQKQISLEARIVAVADAFEAMVKERPYRNSMIGYTAMRQLLNDNSRRFDSEILKVFIKAIGIYPIGSFVLLNNGGIGRVVRINRGSPLRPVIRVLIDHSGKKYLQNNGPVVDLLAEKEIFIAKAIDPNNVMGVKKTT